MQVYVSLPVMLNQPLKITWLIYYHSSRQCDSVQCAVLCEYHQNSLASLSENADGQDHVDGQ